LKKITISLTIQTNQTTLSTLTALTSLTTLSTLSSLVSFIQALVTLLYALGFTRGLATIAKYPAFVIMPVFTFWTFGGSSQIKLSFRLTWINTLITLAGEIEGSNEFKGVLEE